MTASSSFMLKKAVSAGLIMTLLGSTIGCTVASSGYDNQPIYRGDGGYNTVNYNLAKQQLRQDLRRQGYQVMDIRADNYRGNRVLKAYAKKGNQAYEFIYSYPNLKLLNTSKKQWAEIGHDKGYNNGKYNHNKRYDNDDIEDRIKKDSRYPAIKQRAIRKVTAMGYRVKDIELDEKNNRGVFEIEAKKGSQEYEILLSYPNLNVIKIEKD